MTVKISEYELTCKCPQKLYEIMLDDVEIDTVVTHDPGLVSAWIKKIKILNESHPHRLIVGLHIEWKQNLPNYPLYSRRLRQFLQKETYEFVGVGIESDVKKLNYDCGLLVSKKVVLWNWAAAELEKKDLLTAGLKDLVKKIVRIEILKPKSTSMSTWDQRRLSPKQICYACLDAYLSFEVGRLLSA